MNKNDTSRMPPAETGNASNPSSNEYDMKPMEYNQLLDEKAETYIRESGNIEDLPDAGDQEEMDRTIEEKKGE